MLRIFLLLQKKFNIFDISIVAGNDDNAFILNRYEGAGQQDITVLARDGILDYDNPNNLKERTIVVSIAQSPSYHIYWAKDRAILPVELQQITKPVL